MFELIVGLKAHDLDGAQAVASALREMRPVCLAEPGCVSWEAYQSSENPRVFTLVECWTSQDSWEAHGHLEAITKIYVPRIVPLVDRDVHPSVALR